MKKSKISTKRAISKVRTLAIDIGGTGIKGSILDGHGKMVAERIRVKTPYPFRPKNLLMIIQKIARSLPTYDRVSMGFPGVVRDGHIITAPHFNTKHWQGYPLADRVSQLLKKPAKALNDADVQGFGAIKGRGLEVVLTLGTGVGSSVFIDGKLAPHMELAHHPIHDNKTYNEYLGNDALRDIHRKKWNQRVRHMIAIVHTLLNYDILYIGGGNAKKITGRLPSNVRVSSNDAGITGGVHLWDK
jgi:polyphosphate glucokinase